MEILDLTESEKQRFWATVTKTDGCWLCRSVPSGTYARISFRRRLCLAHVVSFIMSNGFVPDGMIVCHTCDTPRCVRPDHLEAKTQSENMRDMVARKRNKLILGSANNLSKLTDEEVIEIKHHLINGTKSILDLANEHRVSFQGIWRIGTGLSRKHVGPQGRLIPIKPRRSFTDEEVLEIRRRALVQSQRSIATAYGVLPPVISNLVLGKRRKWLPFVCQTH